MDAHEHWLERTRSVVLFSQRSKLYDEGDQGRARALRGSGVAELVRVRPCEVSFIFSGASDDPLCQCRVEQQTLSFHPSSQRRVRLRTF